jgi:large subunit ribosomal protein L18
MAVMKDRAGPRKLRHGRVRRTVSGTAERPRLAVFKSAKHTYAQVIDDTAGTTLVAVSTLNSDFRKQAEGLKPVEVANKLGQVVAGKVKEKGLSKVVFDRGGFPYTGRVKAVAEGARTAGLDF